MLKLNTLRKYCDLYSLTPVPELPPRHKLGSVERRDFANVRWRRVRRTSSSTVMFNELGLKMGDLERHLSIGSTSRNAAYIAALRRVGDELGASSGFLAMLANGFEGAVEKVRNLVGQQIHRYIQRCIDDHVAKSTFDIAKIVLRHVSESFNDSVGCILALAYNKLIESVFALVVCGEAAAADAAPDFVDIRRDFALFQAPARQGAVVGVGVNMDTPYVGNGSG
jgi:hypothetical protein